jgi:anti-sigma regulatory factor (Ser/Thr protein kinase)
VLDRVLLWAEDDRVICEVRDHGFGLTDPLAGYRLPELDSTSGRGLWLARQLVDLVEVRSGRSGSTFRLHAWRSGPTAPGHCAV